MKQIGWRQTLLPVTILNIPLPPILIQWSDSVKVFSLTYILDPQLYHDLYRVHRFTLHNISKIWQEMNSFQYNTILIIWWTMSYNREMFSFQCDVIYCITFSGLQFNNLTWQNISLQSLSLKFSFDSRKLMMRFHTLTKLLGVIFIW